jgi:hypothetical protein
MGDNTAVARKQYQRQRVVDRALEKLGAPPLLAERAALHRPIVRIEVFRERLD